MCNIGNFRKMVNVEPLQVPAPVPGQQPEPEPEVHEPVYVEVKEPAVEKVPQ
jgi:hypothetical protein